MKVRLTATIAASSDQKMTAAAAALFRIHSY